MGSSALQTVKDFHDFVTVFECRVRVHPDGLWVRIEALDFGVSPKITRKRWEHMHPCIELKSALSMEPQPYDRNLSDDISFRISSHFRNEIRQEFSRTFVTFPNAVIAQDITHMVANAVTQLNPENVGVAHLTTRIDQLSHQMQNLLENQQNIAVL